MPATASVTFTLSCEANPGARGELINTASAFPAGGCSDNRLELAGPGPALASDQRCGNNQDSSGSTTLTPLADLSIVKEYDRSVAGIGDDIVYTLTISNAGPSHAFDVNVRDVYERGLGIVSQWSCQQSGPSATLTGSMSAPVGGQLDTQLDIFANNSIVCEIVLEPTGEYFGLLSNTASVDSGDAADPDDNNNESAVEITAIPTLSAWMLLVLMVLLGWLAYRQAYTKP